MENFFVILIIVAIYFIPTIVAHWRRHKNVLAIGMLNLLFGWTFLGWAVAIIWSFTSDVLPPPAKPLSQNFTPPADASEDKSIVDLSSAVVSLLFFGVILLICAIYIWWNGENDSAITAFFVGGGVIMTAQAMDIADKKGISFKDAAIEVIKDLFKKQPEAKRPPPFIPKKKPQNDA